MGREGENRASGGGEPPSAADSPQGVGCLVWRITRGAGLSFGNERAAALGVPRHRSGLRGRAACPTSCATLQACHGGCATWHTCLAAARIGKHGERGRPWGLPLGLSSVDTPGVYPEDRKSTRLNSSH